jgi:hypothetical protein
MNLVWEGNTRNVETIEESIGVPVKETEMCGETKRKSEGRIHNAVITVSEGRHGEAEIGRWTVEVDVTGKWNNRL